MKMFRGIVWTMFWLLTTVPMTQAFLGDDFAAVEGRYGAALVRQQLAPGMDVTVHETVGYRVVVLYRDGHSHRETFAKLAVPFDFTEGEISSFLRAHADGQHWDQIATTNTVQSWERPGATATYLANGDKTNLAFERLGTTALLAAATPAPDADGSSKTTEKGLNTGKLSLGKLQAGKLAVGKLETGPLTVGPLAINKLQTGKLSVGKLEGAAANPTPSPSPVDVLTKALSPDEPSPGP